MKKYTYTEKKDTRSGFGAGLLELGKRKRSRRNRESFFSPL
jgi:transketolase